MFLLSLTFSNDKKKKGDGQYNFAISYCWLRALTVGTCQFDCGVTSDLSRPVRITIRDSENDALLHYAAVIIALVIKCLGM